MNCCLFSFISDNLPSYKRLPRQVNVPVAQNPPENVTSEIHNKK